MFPFCPREGKHEPYEESSRMSPTQVKPLDTIDHNTDHWMFLEETSKDGSSLILMVSAFLLLLVITSICTDGRCVNDRSQ